MINDDMAVRGKATITLKRLALYDYLRENVGEHTLEEIRGEIPNVSGILEVQKLVRGLRKLNLVRCRGTEKGVVVWA